MIHIYRNIYKSENFSETILVKKCCKGASTYLVKCDGCQQFFCFDHVRDKKVGKDTNFVCTKCFFED